MTYWGISVNTELAQGHVFILIKLRISNHDILKRIISASVSDMKKLYNID